MGTDSDSVKRQTRVVSALEHRNPKLASIYTSALNMLNTEPAVGYEAARVAIVCHCMRELMTGLPAVMADSAIPRPQPSSSSLVSKLPNLLAEHPDLDLALDNDMVPVPKKVAQAFVSLVTAATQERGRNRSNAAALVTGGSDRKHPAIAQWLESYEFFVGWAHLDRNHERQEKLASDDELFAAIRVVEDVVEVRTRAFFDNIRALEDLLAEINAPCEEE